MDFLVASFLLFLSWFLGKIADSHNEHGLIFWKKYTILFWISWWLIWVFLFGYSEFLFIPLVSLLLYWIYKMKFDYKNHIISLIIMLFWILFFAKNNYFIYIFILFFIYFVLDFFKKNKKIWKYIFIAMLSVPIFFAIYIKNTLPITCIFFFLWSNFCIKVFKIDQKYLQ